MKFLDAAKIISKPYICDSTQKLLANQQVHTPRILDYI